MALGEELQFWRISRAGLGNHQGDQESKEMSVMRTILLLHAWLLTPLSCAPIGWSLEPFLEADSVVVGTVVSVHDSRLEKAQAGKSASDRQYTCTLSVRVAGTVSGTSLGPEPGLEAVTWPSLETCSSGDKTHDQLWMIPICGTRGEWLRVCGLPPRLIGPLKAAVLPPSDLTRIQQIAWTLLHPQQSSGPSAYGLYLEYSLLANFVWPRIGSYETQWVLELLMRKHEDFRPAACRYLSGWPFGLCNDCRGNENSSLYQSEGQLVRQLDLLQKMPRPESFETLDDLKIMACSSYSTISQRALQMARDNGQRSFVPACFSCKLGR